jgi:hypothetical protein
MTSDDTQYYDLIFGGIPLGKMYLPLRTDINSQVYENYFISGLQDIMREIQSKNPFGRDTDAANSLRNLISDTIRKSLTGKFKAAWEKAQNAHAKQSPKR